MGWLRWQRDRPRLGIPAAALGVAAVPSVDCERQAIPGAAAAGALCTQRTMSTLLLTLLLASPQISGGGFDRTQLQLGDAAGDLMGDTLGSMPDVTGDGIGELIGGAWAADAGGFTNSGVIRVWSGVDGSLLWEVSGPQDFAQMGLAVAAMADMNSDGLADVAVGASQGNGEVHILSGLDGSLIRLFPAPGNADDFGEALSNAGDLDGDGKDDLFVGAGDTDGGMLLDSGRVYAISGDTGVVIWNVPGEERLDHCGRAVLAIPDRNGDGKAECLAASPLADVGGVSDVGVVRMLDGSTGAEITRFQGQAFRAEFGDSLGLAGDHDGDGIQDIIIGAPREQPAVTPAVGAASVFSGADDSLIFRYAGTVANEWMGSSVGSVGDIDGDGFDEVMIGANGAFYGGRVYFYSGRNGRRLWITESDGFGSDFASRIHPLADYDQDGDLDFMVGEPHRRDAGIDKGAVSVWSFKPMLTSNVTSISSAVGANIVLDVDFPAHSWVFSSNVKYWTIMSLIGTGPTILRGWEIPLGQDGVYDDSLAGIWPGPLQNPSGPLDANGDATVTMNLGPGTVSTLVGRTLHFAVVHFEGSGLDLIVHGSTRPVLIDIVP